MKLKRIANIFSGVSFRTKIEHNPKGKYAVIQMRNLTEGYADVETELDRIDLPKSKMKYVLKENDVIIISKGAYNKAIEMEGMTKPMIATSAFFIIRIKKPELNSGYLTWFLNSVSTQNYFRQNQTGTYTPSLNKSILEDMEIPLPKLEKQVQIAKLDRLHLRERKIQQDLITLREQYIENLLAQSIK